MFSVWDVSTGNVISSNPTNLGYPVDLKLVSNTVYYYTSELPISLNTYSIPTYLQGNLVNPEFTLTVGDYLLDLAVPIPSLDLLFILHSESYNTTTYCVGAAIVSAVDGEQPVVLADWPCVSNVSQAFAFYLFAAGVAIDGSAKVVATTYDLVFEESNALMGVFEINEDNSLTLLIYAVETTDDYFIPLFVQTVPMSMRTEFPFEFVGAFSNGFSIILIPFNT